MVTCRLFGEIVGGGLCGCATDMDGSRLVSAWDRFQLRCLHQLIRGPLVNLVEKPPAPGHNVKGDAPVVKQTSRGMSVRVAHAALEARSRLDVRPDSRSHSERFVTIVAAPDNIGERGSAMLQIAGGQLSPKGGGRFTQTRGAAHPQVPAVVAWGPEQEQIASLRD